MHATRAAKLLPAVLIAIAAVAFLRAEQLKLQHGPIGSPLVHQVFSPACAGQSGCHSQALLHFKLRHAQSVGLKVVDDAGNTVRTLQSARHTPAGKVAARWDGKTDAGAVAPDGQYRLRILLPDRTITIPDHFVLDTVPPTLQIGRVEHLAHRIVIHFLTSEPSTRHMVISKDGQVVKQRTTRPDSARLNLNSLPPGSYQITLYAVDRAGNRTPNPPSITVKVP